MLYSRYHKTEDGRSKPEPETEAPKKKRTPKAKRKPAPKKVTKDDFVMDEESDTGSGT